ncbi:MAG: hypothetical protein CMO01_24475 [Thalassobius sp.]|nr:hypothetical protein [Thalassovita sp.]
MIGKNFLEYFASTDTEDFMGIKVLDIGSGKIPLNTKYPKPMHPTGYYFDWEYGRRLDHYQLVYISNGKGIFEFEGGEQCEVSAGTFFVVYPKVWHRYKPAFNTGWDEHWVGFRASTHLPFLHNESINPSNPIHQIGIDERIINLFHELTKVAENKTSGFSSSLAGGVFYLAGIFSNGLKNYQFKSSQRERQLQHAISLMHNRINLSFNLEEIATEVGMSYSLFRQLFTSYTGLSPKKYFLNLKLSKSLELLKYSDMQVKEIAHQMGFETTQYFTRFIKQRVGKNPQSLRKT